MGMTIEIPEGYEELGLSLQGALEQASAGKGKARHAEEGESFGRQAILIREGIKSDGGGAA